MRKIKFVSDTNCLYHIYNRGVEKRDIFVEKGDYVRFIHDLFEFNNTVFPKRFIRCKNSIKGNSDDHKRNIIVEILAYCLMPNHYHLLVRQVEDGGIIKFMQKVGTGYTMYFNSKYKRSGVLFQGKFKSALINNEGYFRYIPYYIHANPLDLMPNKLKSEESFNLRESLRFLESYRWSSYLDYIGDNNFPSVISSKFLNEFWNGSEQYKKSMKDCLRDKKLNNIDESMMLDCN
jgi:putative transposase